jgi:hypothetical protein
VRLWTEFDWLASNENCNNPLSFIKAENVPGQLSDYSSTLPELISWLLTCLVVQLFSYFSSLFFREMLMMMLMIIICFKVGFQ